MFDSIGGVPDPVCLSGVLANDVRVKEHGLLADATGVVDQGDDLLPNVTKTGNVGRLGHLVPVGDVLPEAGHLVDAVTDVAEHLDV